MDKPTKPLPVVLNDINTLAFNLNLVEMIVKQRKVEADAHHRFFDGITVKNRDEAAAVFEAARVERPDPGSPHLNAIRGHCTGILVLLDDARAALDRGDAAALSTVPGGSGWTTPADVRHIINQLSSEYQSLSGTISSPQVQQAESLERIKKLFTALKLADDHLQASLQEQIARIGQTPPRPPASTPAAPDGTCPIVKKGFLPRRLELMKAAGMKDQTLLAVIKAAGLFKDLRGFDARDEEFSPEAVLKLRRTALEGTYIRRLYCYWGWERWSAPDPLAGSAPPKPDDLEPVG